MTTLSFSSANNGKVLGISSGAFGWTDILP